MTLGAVVTTQIGNLFAQRTTNSSLRQVGLFTNRLLWLGITSELVLFALIIYVPFLQRVFGTAPLDWQAWLFLMLWTPALLLADWVRKQVTRRRVTGAEQPVLPRMGELL
jgi:magnesium-transporting ATPase (P-type)